MLNKEKLQTVEGLSDDQITAIETLSKHDEQSVIDKRIGEIYGQLDNDVKEVTGLEKPSGIKTYEFIKNTIADFKGKAESAQTRETEITTLKGEIRDLKEKIKAGTGDEKLKNDLKTAQEELQRVQDTYKTEKQQWEGKVSEKENELKSFQVRSKLENAAASLKFKPSDIIPEDVKALTVKNAINQILETHTYEEYEGQMVFKNKAGEVIRDKDNGLAPMTPEKMLSTPLASILEEGKPGGGGGGKPPAGKTPATSIKNARTQIEAGEVIEKDLAARGLAKGTKNYQEEYDKIWAENEVSKLPIK